MDRKLRNTFPVNSGKKGKPNTQNNRKKKAGRRACRFPAPNRHGQPAPGDPPGSIPCSSRSRGRSADAPLLCAELQRSTHTPGTEERPEVPPKTGGAAAVRGKTATLRPPLLTLGSDQDGEQHHHHHGKKPPTLHDCLPHTSRPLPDRYSCSRLARGQHRTRSGCAVRYTPRQPRCQGGRRRAVAAFPFGASPCWGGVSRSYPPRWRDGAVVWDAEPAATVCEPVLRVVGRPQLFLGAGGGWSPVPRRAEAGSRVLRAGRVESSRLRQAGAGARLWDVRVWRLSTGRSCRQREAPDQGAPKRPVRKTK